MNPKKQRREVKTSGYTEYYAVESEAGRIGLLSCTRCGSTLIVNESQTNVVALHDKFHDSYALPTKNKKK